MSEDKDYKAEAHEIADVIVEVAKKLSPLTEGSEAVQIAFSIVTRARSAEWEREIYGWGDAPSPAVGSLRVGKEYVASTESFNEKQ